MSSSSDINWDSLPFDVPDNITNYDCETQISIFNYLSQLDTIQRTAYLIAKEHLGSSFNILRSTGYIEWKKQK